MKSLLSATRPRLGAWLLAGCWALGFGGRGVQAQVLNYGPAGASNVAGAYADLGTAGTVIATANNDDANSAPQNIGFTFEYNFQTFTQFVLNTNGFVRLGAAPPSSDAMYLSEGGGINVNPLQSLQPADVNIAAPFNFDLTNGAGPGGAEFRVATAGAAPNRVCTIQWKNVADKGRTALAQYASFSFQVKLYETTNVVEFVYDAASVSTASAALRRALVGLKGSGWASGQVVQATKGEAAAWSAAGFTGTVTAGTLTTFDYNSSAAPDAGRTFRFVPTALPANDAAVTALYTLGKVAGAVAPTVTVQAVVRNNGRTALANVPVTLAVSGATPFADTQTLAALPAGASATVTFAPYAVAASRRGTNNLTVSVPPDDVNANNTQTFAQTLTADELSYSSGGPLTGGLGVGGTSRSAFAVRYSTSGPAVLTAVTPTFVGANATGTNPTYLVRVYTAGAGGLGGTPVYTSPPRPRPAQGGPDAVPVPNVAVNGGFFVTVETTTPYNIGLGYETETPLRPGTFYYIVITTNFGWTDLNTQPALNPRLALDVTVAAPLGARAQLGQGELTAYPNPARAAATVNIPAVADARAATLTLLNALGQAVRTSQVALQANGTTAPLGLAGLASGLYTLRVQAGAESAALRLAVE